MQLEDTETPRKHVHECVCGVVCVCTDATPPHTHSSADMSRGLMYSKPSNSDWSIFFTTSLKKEKKNGGEKIKKLVKIDRKLRLQQEMSTK